MPARRYLTAVWMNPLREDSTFSTYRMFLTGFFVMAMLVGSIVGVETVELGPLSLPAGAFVFPLCFSALTIVQEVYGIPQSVRLALVGITMFGLAIIIVSSINLLPPAPEAVTRTQAFRTLYGVPPRVLGATVLGFSVAQAVGLFLLYTVAHHTSTDQRLLWLRLIGAPLAMQLTTLCVTIPVAFFGQGIAPSLLVSLIWTRIIYAVIFANVSAPFVWFAVLHIRHRELPRPQPHPRYPDVFREEEPHERYGTD